MTSGQTEDDRGLASHGWDVPNNRNSSPLQHGFDSSKSYLHGNPQTTQGEALRSIGALSAPPPPGFSDGTDKSRPGFNEQQIWLSQEETNRVPNTQNNGIAGGARTSSFTNLAAALGSGLAETIDDSVLMDSFFSSTPEGDLSYARHSRHAASRLRNAPSKDSFGPSHKASNAGDIFGTFNGGQKKGLGHSGYLEDFSKDRERPATGNMYGSGPGSGLSAAFSKEPVDRSRGQYPPTTTSTLNYSNLNTGNGFNVMNSRLSTTKDLGMTVTEPTDSYGRSSAHQRNDDGMSEINRNMKNLWSQDSNDNMRRNNESSGFGSPVKDSGRPQSDNGDTERQAEEDLRPFTWDVRHHEGSRALAIMRASSLHANDVRSICEKFGTIDTFRPDFSDRGIFFVSYHDMRCAQFAAAELRSKLQRLDAGGDKVLVQFCVPLNSSSQNDDSIVILTDVPAEIKIEQLAHMLSSFGGVRSLKSHGGSYGGSSFVAEYHDVQDAKQAVLELESTQPWGPNVFVETGTRNPSDRKRGRELLALTNHWRQGGGSYQDRRGPPTNNNRPHSQAYGTQYIPGSNGPRYDVRYERGPPQETQVVVGPDGTVHRYVVVNHSGYPPSYGGPPAHHIDHGPNHGTYVTHHVAPSSSSHYWQSQNSQQHHISGGSSVVSDHSGYHSTARSMPYYPADASSVGSHSRNVRSVPESGTPKMSDDKDNRHLRLDFDAVENGRDSRTSLMVRNIPNKYTQQMLLAEFGEHGHGPGVIDFFYLPIDFKNKCNRGYAFINFVDYRDILPFHQRYYGKHWRTFNSDKICEITYARIQGKAAMLKRFENSALMEKDEEYKPLVFVSHGPDKGTRLPFPGPDASHTG